MKSKFLETDIGLVLLSYALNVILGIFGTKLNGLLFLDTIGTALIALSRGPWYGAFVGTLTNLTICMFPCKQQYFNYLIVNVIFGLFLGYVGQTKLRLFTENSKYKTLFLKIVLVGVIGGLITSTISLFTTFNFVWNLSDIDLNKFRQWDNSENSWHLTDRYYHWLFQHRYINPSGNILQVLYRDVIAILPDKIISIALSVLIIYYFFPRLEFDLRKGNEDKGLRNVTKNGLFLFLVVYICCFFYIAFKGNVFINVNTCKVIETKVILVQVLLWTVPILLALPFLFYKNGKQRKLNEKILMPERMGFVKSVYQDILTVLGAAFAFIIYLAHTTFQRETDIIQPISQLLEDGLGIAIFFAVFSFLPTIIMRFFSCDPESKD
ncbi:MAG: hypothetical protein QM802_22435 [Agriterribacter sp.]